MQLNIVFKIYFFNQVFRRWRTSRRAKTTAAGHRPPISSGPSFKNEKTNLRRRGRAEEASFRTEGRKSASVEHTSGRSDRAEVARHHQVRTEA